MTRARWWFAGKALAVAAFFALPLLYAPPSPAGAAAGDGWRPVNGYVLGVLGDIGLYALLALSLNVILGHAGLFHMGHAAFYAIGAYTTANLSLHWHWPIYATLPAAGLAAGLAAVAVAAPIIHLRGDYLLMVTIAIVEIVRQMLINDVFGLTGGADGLFGYDVLTIPFVGTAVVEVDQWFWVIWGFVAVSLVLFRWLELSRFGRALKYIKEDAVAAEGMGVDTTRYKLAAFAIGAVWAGFAGTFYAAKQMVISPGSFTFDESVLLFVIVILGGRGSQRGVLLGAFLVAGLPELFRQIDQVRDVFPSVFGVAMPDRIGEQLGKARFLFFGAALVAMMIFRPQGILPPKPRRYDLPEPLPPPPAPSASSTPGGTA